MLGAIREKLGARMEAGSQSRTAILTILILAVVLGGLFLWRGLRTAPGAMPPPQAVPVAAAIIAPREAPVSLEAVGTLTAVREVTLAPEVPGRVTAIRFKAGKWVRSGDLLVQLYDGTERADRKAAVARAEFARIQLERSEELAPTGAEPRELLQQRRAERNQAVAAVQQIDARIRQKQVRAPFTGQLGIRRVNPGQYVNPGDPIATLTSLDSLFVEFALPQQELSKLKTGATVNVTSDAFPGRTFTARVNAIEPMVGEDTRNVTVQALLANRDHALRPGMYVTAALMLSPQKNALIVPATAVQTSAQGNSVVVIRGKEARKGGKAEIVPVKTGRRIGDGVVIEQGLEPNDVVVADGQLRVQPGAEVKVTSLVGSEAQ